eukprot:2474794-Lingulodinium_polyedra.AAC.1
MLVQEHHLRGEAIDDASQWLIARGWQRVWAEAFGIGPDGAQGGVAVFAVTEWGLRPGECGDEGVICPGR